jgi:hypothetical protein
MQGFHIASLRAAGGELGLCPAPGRDGDYLGDLTAIVEWRPAMVVSMTTMAELVQVGAATFGDDLAHADLRWWHIPVADFGADSPALREIWPKAAQVALAALGTGGRVLIHCQGGCGRSGMAVLRLMVEAGEPGVAALGRLRAVRPCAVETEAQRGWALGAAGGEG